MLSLYAPYSSDNSLNIYFVYVSGRSGLAMLQSQIVTVIFVWEGMNISVLLCQCFYIQLHNMLHHEMHGPSSDGPRYKMCKSD